ncbi:LuxR C-terminal-related transcriptional regulator [Mycobacterium sp.]|uniref:helix-turn-helix transcriptional regulator n=1 Tax=Mycobacterium sp. TaxID=1785 RepID=UPI003BB6E4FA
MVGRSEEVRQALTALGDAAKFRGVVLIGDSGVGKSTLARALADILESRKLNVRFALCTETGRAVPFGAFYWLTTLATASEPAAMLAAAQRALEQEENLVVAVDDAHLLDPLSASLVYHLAAVGSARLIVTIKSGHAVPDPVLALWKDQLLLTLRVEAFTRQQTELLARTVLGGEVATELIDGLQDRTAGNPLLLRGLLIPGREKGVLVHTDAGWQLHGTLRGDRQLYDLLEFRLRSFEPEELEAVEVLGAAEVLDWEVMRGLCDADAVGRLERRGIIQLVADHSQTVARLFHAVLGEVALQRAGVVRTRQLNGLLAQHLQKQMEAAERYSRRVDVRSQVQLAQFMMRSDLTPDLDLTMDAAASALRMGNIDCGAELARFALEHGGGLRAAIMLAEAMFWQGQTAAVDAVLAEVDPQGAIEFVTAHGCLRATNMFFRGHVEQARQELLDLRDRVESGARAELITAVEVLFAYLTGDVSTAVETGLALCAQDVSPIVKAWVAAPLCWALAFIGRTGDFHRIADAGLRAAELGQSSPLKLIIGVAEALVSTEAGDYSAAERVRQRFAAMPASAHAGHPAVDVMLGLVNLGRGALASACSAFHNSLSAMSGTTSFTWSMVVAAWTAQAEGARGNHEAATAALRHSEEAYGPQTAVYLSELELARAWERACVGETAAALRHSLRAAHNARKSGMYAVELGALHTAVRFGDQKCAARVERLARILNTPLAEAVAVHARGLANHDGDLLDVAARLFADLGAMAFAADAGAQAAAEHAPKGHRAKEVESSIRAYRLARQCGLRSPAVTATARPLPITNREIEIADLVTAGLSNRQIADQLYISVRTTEGHLYRIFAKLGINNRDQLMHLLALNRFGSPDDVRI